MEVNSNRALESPRAWEGAQMYIHAFQITFKVTTQRGALITPDCILISAIFTVLDIISYLWNTAVRYNFLSVEHHLSFSQLHLLFTETRVFGATDDVLILLTSAYLFPLSLQNYHAYTRNDTTCSHEYILESSKHNSIVKLSL